MKDFIISPPFGNYLNFDWATSVKGSYTVLPRPGLLWAALKTLRKTENGWVNKIGLKNPGMYNIHYDSSHIYSFAPLTLEDYVHFLRQTPSHVELNLSCPNAQTVHIDVSGLATMVNRFNTVIVKMPTSSLHFKEILYMSYDAGVRWFHFCNTLPTKNGGLSGSKVKEVSLLRIEQAKKLFPDIRVIGGGGIYTKQDIEDYKNVGAEKFSLSTIWFTPWKVFKLFEEEVPLFT